MGTNNFVAILYYPCELDKLLQGLLLLYNFVIQALLSFELFQS